MAGSGYTMWDITSLLKAAPTAGKKCGGCSCVRCRKVPDLGSSLPVQTGYLWRYVISMPRTPTETFQGVSSVIGTRWALRQMARCGVPVTTNQPQELAPG